MDFDGDSDHDAEILKGIFTGCGTGIGELM